MSSRWLRSLLLMSTLLGAALAIPARPYRGSRSGVRQAVHTGDSAGGEGSIKSMREKWLTQRIDHFSPDSRTFQQRYFINTTFYEAGGPIFLCVGGEGPPLDEAQILICTRIRTFVCSKYTRSLTFENWSCRCCSSPTAPWCSSAQTACR